MGLPVDVRDLLKAGDRLRSEREEPVRLSILVEIDAPDVVIDALRERLRPRTSSAALQIEVAEPGAPPVVPSDSDAVVALAGGGGPDLARALEGPRMGRIPVVVLALGDGPDRKAALADRLYQPIADILLADEASELIDTALGGWLAEELGHKRLALANNFTFMRRAVAEEAVRTTAVQNGLIGTVALIPGADMPLMTANQAKMLLQIAAAYGEHLGTERIKELAAIVGGGFAFREVARQGLAFVPVLGWAVKGGVAYGGTLAMGKAAIEYFERGADLGEVVGHIKGTAAAKIPARLRRAADSDDAVALPGHVQPALPGTEPPVE